MKNGLNKREVKKFGFQNLLTYINNINLKIKNKKKRYEKK